MKAKPRLTPKWLLAGWALLLCVVVASAYFAGPAPSRIAFLSVSDGMFMTFGSIALLGSACAFILTLILLHWAVVGTEGLFELSSPENASGFLTTSWLARAAVLGGYALAALLSCYLLFVRLGKTLLCEMLQDSFIYFDGAQRIAHGQQQHIDFHTPMGVFANLLPYWGSEVTGDLAGSLEWGFLIGGCFLLAVGVPLVASRLTAAAAIPLVLYLGLLAVVPMNVEGMPETVTHAMFINRLGWIAMTLVFLVFLEPRFQSKAILACDSACLFALLFFLFYLKLSYLAVCLAFLPLLFLSSRYNRWLSGWSFALLAVGVGLMELRYGLNGPYLRDLQMAIEASGANRGSMIPKFVANINEFAIVAGAIALVWDRRAPNWLYVLFAGFVCLAGLAVIDQNTQTKGVVCLLALALVSQEILRRGTADPAATDDTVRVRRLKSAVCLGLAALFVLQPIFYRLTSMAMIRSAVTQVKPEMPDGLRGFVLAEHLWKQFCAGRTRDPITNKVITANRPVATAEEVYFQSIRDGLNVLSEVETSGKRLIVFDYVTPFTSILSMAPAKGGHTCIDLNRTMCDADFTPPDELLGEVDYVMIPKVPCESYTTAFLSRVYGEYLHDHFEPSKSTDFWDLWIRRP